LTDTPPNNPRNDRIGGGGAAPSAGIRFEQQLGALISSWMLAGDRFDACFRLGPAAPALAVTHVDHMNQSFVAAHHD
jgi:hypothetical protein